MPSRAGNDPARSGPDSGAFFEAKVRPVLAEHCFACHGPQKQKGGLRLDSLLAIRAGGDSGPAVEPGDPEASLLVEAIRYDGDVRMPPKGKLKDAEIAALTDWVKSGVPWPKPDAPVRPAATPAAKVVTEEDRAFWSFRPVQDPPPPPVQDAAWPRSPIDTFILAGLEAKGLRPAPPADRRTLIRRATFDLIGLPPMPEEIAAFENDDAPDAFAKVVDRLLASPHYGERWGRHWLDVARYGEDQAHSFQPRLYPNGFRYRDWLVAALNADMPYDRFLLEQVAGDLLDEPGRHERLPALGFFALGPVYYGDPKKLDQIDDRIDTLTRGVLGLTVACARCHDHKFDPIPTADYYALAGVFASTEYEEAPFAPREQVEAYEKAQTDINARTREIDTFLRAESARLVAARAAEIARYVVASWTLKVQRAGGGETAPEVIAKQEGLDPARLGRWASLLDATPEQAKERPQLAALLERIDRPAPKAECASDESLRREVETVAEDFQKQVLALLARSGGFVPRESGMAKKSKAAGGGKEAPASGTTLAEPDRALLEQLFGEKGVMALPKNLEEELPGEAREKLSRMRTEMERRKTSAPPKYPVAHALKDAPKPTDMKVLVRGNPATPGPEVPRRFLTILGGDRAPFAQGSGRLELARALVRTDNPLTPRVMVNRIWQHHFGRGLVGTTSNFGALGERPSHPELLDYLAHAFVAGGWSIKAMHRAIMSSATYQQSSRFDAHAFEVDPENTRLWRMARRRLEVEAWRDAMLAVSGRLDRSIGGSSRTLDDPGNRRRTFYAAISRHDLAPLLRLFDFPDPNITSAERTRTTVPLQQLVVLNSEPLIETARALAALLGSDPGEDAAARIRRAYLLLFSRPASEAEVQLGLAYLGAHDADAKPAGDLSRWERYAQVLLGTNEFLFVD